MRPLLLVAPLYVLLFSGAFYALLVLAFRIGLGRLHRGTETATPMVSVVVPAHNESSTIDICLAHLAAQDYPSGRLEVVVVDDRSSDDTFARAQRWSHRLPGLRVVSVLDPPFRCPKKSALDLGIRSGAGELILTTDADCRPPPSWVSSTVRCFSPRVGLVAGYAPLQSRGHPLGGLLALQSLVVSALAAGSSGIGFPLTCSGRNLAYRRSAFEAVGGFQDIGQIRGGDDVLLMRKIATSGAWRVGFNPDPAAAVPSNAHTDGLFNRHVRYQSKAVHSGTRVLLLALPVYIFHLAIAAGAFLLWSYPGFWVPLLIAISGKLLADALFLGWVAGALHVRRVMGWLPLLEILSVPYILLFCALGSLKPTRWS